MEIFSMRFKGLPLLLAPVTPAFVPCVVCELAEGTEPEADVLGSLDLPEVGEDDAQRPGTLFCVPWPSESTRLGKTRSEAEPHRKPWLSVKSHCN